MKRLPPGILLLTTATALIAGTLLGSSPGAFIEKGSPPVRSPFHGFLDRLTATGIPDKARQAEGISAEDRIAVIRIAYDLLEDYAASDVSDLRFELSDFELLHPADFEKRLFTDVVTMPGGLMVNVLRSRHTYTNTGEVTLLYITKWTEEEAQPFTDSEGRPLDTMVISEVCDVWVKQGSPEMAAVELITSYRVTVSLRGEQREYQAAFFWYAGAAPGDINFLVMDHVTQGVAEAVKELEPPICDPQPECRDSRLKSLSLRSETSPILIDFGGHGFRLTSAADGVEFDLNADGTAEQIAWTEAESADAFLVFDRNSNGVIENGKELFGNVFHPNGFITLAAYDTADAGGNEDDLISAEDAFFPLLLLWTDVNHNGFSERSELAPLGSQVEAIELDYVESRRVDRFGNQYRYLGKAHLAGNGGGHRKTKVVDVFLTATQ